MMVRSGTAARWVFCACVAAVAQEGNLRCTGTELAVADGEDTDAQLRTGGYELAVGGGGGSGRVLGSRQLARYYRQSYRPSDSRRSVAVASVLAQCAIAFISNGFRHIEAVEAAILLLQESQVCALHAACHTQQEAC